MTNKPLPMSKTKQVTFILLSFAAIIFLPLLGSLIYHQGQFPSGVFAYPMLAPKPKAPFSWLVFGLVAAGGLVLICVYLFPHWFGFKKTGTPPEPNVKK